MTDLHKAAQQALEALEGFAYHGKAAGWPETITNLRAALAQQAEPDLSLCPQCNGPADNGHDRSIPPHPYLCTKCMAKMPQPSYNVTVVDDAHPNGIPLEQWQNKPVAWRCACGANLYIDADGAPRSKAESVEPVAYREDIIRMAREAASEDGSIDRKDGKNVVLYAAKTSRFLERLAALAAAAEREACAKVCDDKAKETFSGQCQVWGDYFARVIRARSNT